MNWNNSYDNTPRHKTFISFHHADDYYREQFETHVGEYMNGFISQAVGDGDIDDSRMSTERIRQVIRDDYISDATVTVVLIGKETWKRKHVDWEIASSIRDTQKNARTGLLGILIPTYTHSTHGSHNISHQSLHHSENGDVYYQYNIPPRLHFNVENGFAKIYSWPENPSDVKMWIHDAFLRRNQKPNNRYPQYAKNRGTDQTHWS